MEETKELEIISEILNGNTEKFGVIAEKYAEQLFRVALGYMHSKEEAEDIVQEVLIKAFNSLNTFKGNSKLSTWLYRITVNSCLNQINKHKRTSLFSSIEEIKGQGLDSSDQKNPEQQLIEEERNLKVRKAIDSLPTNQKTAFILQRYKELSQKEISEVMGVTEGAVEQLLQRGKRHLKKRLKKSVGKTAK